MTRSEPTTDCRGFAVLDTRPAGGVVEPITFTTLRGDDTDPRLDEARYGVMGVRLEVFVGEQDVPFCLEIDTRDFEATTVHVLASGADGAALGTGRLLLDPEHPGQAHLGRLAVRRVARGTGLGARLVTAIEGAALDLASAPLAQDAAEAAGVRPGTPGVTLVLSAQEQAMGFYERCGYRAVSGQRYRDAGIWHQDMARVLTSAPARFPLAAPVRTGS